MLFLPEDSPIWQTSSIFSISAVPFFLRVPCRLFHSSPGLRLFLPVKLSPLFRCLSLQVWIFFRCSRETRPFLALRVLFGCSRCVTCGGSIFLQAMALREATPSTGPLPRNRQPRLPVPPRFFRRRRWLSGTLRFVVADFLPGVVVFFPVVAFFLTPCAGDCSFAVFSDALSSSASILFESFSGEWPPVVCVSSTNSSLLPGVGSSRESRWELLKSTVPGGMSLARSWRTETFLEGSTRGTPPARSAGGGWWALLYKGSGLDDFSAVVDSFSLENMRSSAESTADTLFSRTSAVWESPDGFSFFLPVLSGFDFLFRFLASRVLFHGQWRFFRLRASFPMARLFS